MPILSLTRSFPFNLTSSFRPALIVAAAMTACSATSAMAADISWVGYQAGPPYLFRNSASWFHGDQWFNYVVPGASDEAVFNGQFDPQGNGMPTTVYFGDYLVGAEPPTIPTSFTVPGGHASISRLRVEHGDFTFRFASSSGTPQGSLTTAAQMIIADIANSTASLTVRDGRLTTNFVTHIASGLNSNGAITVSGLGAEWINSAWYVDLGWVGQGTMRVLDGAQAHIGDNIYAGIRDGSSGRIEVAGGGQLLVARAIVLGSGHESTGNTNGSLLLEGSGSLVGAENMIVGATGAGNAVVRQGATLRADDLLRIGASVGSCSLVASNGAVVEAREVSVGSNAASRNNTVDLNGTGTLLRVGANLGLGANGSAGHLAVINGARVVVTGDTYLGIGGGSEGTVAIDGANSALLSRNVFVGQDGSTAIATLRNGAQIQVTDSVRVRAGGSLSGNGVIIGNLVNEGGFISPGLSPGLLSVQGSLELWSSSVVHMEIGGSTPDLFDRLMITGNASLAGTLILDFTGGFVPSPGSRFDIISAGGTFSGNFNAFDIRGIDPSLVSVSNAGGSFGVNIVPTPSAMALLGLGGLMVARRRR